MKVNRNISAVLVNEQLLRNENGLSESLERLSSGFKFNHAKDNPSGVAISYKMQAQINALDRASANTTDGLSIAQTIDGSIGEMTEVAQRLRELCVQAANDTNTQEDKEAIQLEVDQLKNEIDRISRDTEFNGKTLLDGSLDRRTYVTNEDKTKSYYQELSNIIISDGVQADTYKVYIEKSGTKAEQTCTGGTLGTNTITAEQAGTIKINGATADIKEGMNADEVKAAILKAAEQGNTTLDTSNGDYKFVQQRAGSAYSIDISFSNSALEDAIGTPGTLTAGTDAKVHISFTDASGNPITINDASGNPITIQDASGTALSGSDFSPEATKIIDGNQVVIRDKSGFEMSFEVGENITGGTEAYYIEATDIGTLQLQIGANEGNELPVRVPVLNTTSLHIKDLDVSKIGGAAEGISMMDKAIQQISAARSKMGSYENSLEFAQKSLDANNENMTSAISRLEDTDMAKEMTRYTSYNVLDQASISILAQANDMPKQILSLLQF